MANSYSIAKAGPPGDLKQVFCDVTFDNAYPANGWPMTPANFGLIGINHILPGNVNGYDYQWDAANSKLKVYSSNGVELAVAAALSAVVHRLVVWGYGA